MIVRMSDFTGRVFDVEIDEHEEHCVDAIHLFEISGDQSVYVYFYDDSFENYDTMNLSHIHRSLALMNVCCRSIPLKPLRRLDDVVDLTVYKTSPDSSKENIDAHTPQVVSGVVNCRQSIDSDSLQAVRELLGITDY